MTRILVIDDEPNDHQLVAPALEHFIRFPSKYAIVVHASSIICCEVSQKNLLAPRR